MTGDWSPSGAPLPPEPDRPGTAGAERLPDEPFAYMSEPGGARAKIRSPLGLIVFASILAVIGAVGLGLAVVLGAERHSAGPVVSGILAFIIFAGLGIAGLVMGTKRLRWKREYIRITGHQPWI